MKKYLWMLVAVCFLSACSKDEEEGPYVPWRPGDQTEETIELDKATKVMILTEQSKNRILKEQVVEDIKAKLDGAQSVVICSYNGLTVADVTELRALCRAQDVHYCVLKNRLVLKALQEKGIEGLDHLLEGPNAFVFGMKDAVSAPKVINDFIEKKKLTSLEIRGGLLDSKAVDVQTIKSLAALPSREVLLAKLLGSMTNAIGSFVRVVEAYRKQKAGE